jgi:hypothetical protein
MLNTPEGLLFALAALFLLLPVLWAWRLVLLYLLPPIHPPLREEQRPAVTVILPLRGADPSLCDCLRALFAQDYPRYRVHIIVHSPTDPAWGPVRTVLAEGTGRADAVQAEALQEPLPTCSLKVSAQIQAASRLEAGCEVVALLDADAMVPPDWLRSLVAPFVDRRIGVVSGVRWFAPVEPTWGALARHLWNCGCQAQVYVFGIPWGGTMALRAGLFREHGLLRIWRQRFADDTGTVDLLRRLGLGVCFQPKLTIINRETIALGAVCRFVRRQVFNTRLDLARWPLLLGLNAGLWLSVVLAVALAAVGLVWGEVSLLAWFGGLLALHFAGLLSALAVAELAIRRLARRRGEEVPGPALCWKYLAAPLVALVVHGYGLAAAALARRVSWRGIDYSLGGPRRLRLIEYRPYRPAHFRSVVNRSIA